MPETSPDSPIRERALTIDRSFIVRAPAGSGKTDLLTRRFLKLLTAVDEPEEVLAITFTRAATAEMRSRVLADLERASRGDASNDTKRDRLARAALGHSTIRGWRLLEQPHRLNIETIDSLCLRIAHNQPLLSRMGGQLAPTEHAEPLYALAARQTLGRLGSAGPELDAALATLLALRDNNLADCEKLIADMLERRDQWVRVFPLSGNMTQGQWDIARSRLEEPFREEVKRVHGEIFGLMMEQPALAVELINLAQYACDNGNRKIAPLAGLRALPAPGSVAVEHWRCIAHFLLTNGEWRKASGLNVTAGFPKGDQGEKKRMGFLLEKFAVVPGLREALCATRDLPEPRYEERQWNTLRNTFIVLRHAVAELRVIFAEQSVVDFTELGLAAREVLRNKEASPDALLALSGNIKHFLVDEFQDTSRSQHELLTLLIRAWEAGDKRTGFLVGDPMQSIYLFRQAEVELFERVSKVGLVSEEHSVAFEPLELTTNFRSHAGLTTRWNEMFETIFAAGSSQGGVRYSPTVAADPALPGEAVRIYPQTVGSTDKKATSEEREAATNAEARQVLDLIEEHRGRIEQAIATGGEYRVAVLARTRSDLGRIVSLLREKGIPFRGVDLETLNERQELLDLMSLVRALLHPMDRVAWLSVLRAPWCGLTLADLHVLTGSDDSGFGNTPMLELIESRLPLLSEDGTARLRRVAGVLKEALDARFQGEYARSFAQWIEQTWHSLGGPQCLDAAAYENTQAFFELLDQVTPDGVACLTEDFEEEMGRLYARPDPQVSERAGVQLMTIHKAKGLGFDVVIVPGLGRGARSEDPPLIASMERMNSATGEEEILVAPIGERGGTNHPTYAWAREQYRQKLGDELKRLLYVACTRARKSLHLLGAAEVTKSGLRPGKANSLLATAWPALAKDFEAAMKAKQDNVVQFPQQEPQAASVELAAGAAAEPASRLKLRRLPRDIDLSPQFSDISFSGSDASAASPTFERPEGSRDARNRGSVVHALLEMASRGATLDTLRGSARTLLRNRAYFGRALEDAMSEVLNAVEGCMHDADGAWILSGHSWSESEASWTDWKGGRLETLRADRVFIAAASPRETGDGHLWIVDYKMSAPAGDPDFFERQRETYAPQLARYARILREAQGIELPLRFGLYFPRIPKLYWWGGEEA